MILSPSLVYNCQKATQLVLKKQSGSIGLKERLRLAIHLRYCDSCKRFMLQSSAMDMEIKNATEMLLEKPVFLLSDLAKQRILNGLKKP